MFQSGSESGEASGCARGGGNRSQGTCSWSCALDSGKLRGAAVESGEEVLEGLAEGAGEVDGWLGGGESDGGRGGCFVSVESVLGESLESGLETGSLGLRRGGSRDVSASNPWRSFAAARFGPPVRALLS